MKTTFFTLLFIFTLSFTVFSQDKNESREKIKALKIAYLTEQLELSATEAEKFWPIFNAYDKEQHDLRVKLRFEMHKAIKNEGGVETLEEKEAEKLVNLKLSNEKQLYEIQKEFIQKISGVISYKKIIKLQVAEMEFGKKLLKKYHERDKKE